MYSWYSFPKASLILRDGNSWWQISSRELKKPTKLKLFTTDLLLYDFEPGAMVPRVEFLLLELASK